MMKYLVIFCLFFLSCKGQAENPVTQYEINQWKLKKMEQNLAQKVQVVASPQEYLDLPTKIVIFDGCEYLLIESGKYGHNIYTVSLCHKGNCKNPIHKYQAENPK